MLSTWGCATFPKPTLDLQFAGATSLDSRITFTRGSDATLFDSAGTLVYAKHNLLTYSQDFGDTAWTKNNSSASTDVTTSPDGTSTADSLADNVTNDVHNVTRSIAWTAGAFTASFFVKYFNHRWIQVRIGASGNQFWGSFDLLNGAVGSATAGATTTITNVGSGWYRVTVSATLTTAGSANLLFQLGNADVTALASYSGTGTLVYIWGGQLNLSNMEGGVTSSLTTYYPTTTAAYYGPRFDYDPSTLAARGLLIEEARTNSIRNNTMQGAVAGTPGTDPTNWVNTVPAGITQQIIGTGTENGITYIDYKFSGTATGSIVIRPDGETQVVASSGQAWTGSTYVRLIAGSLTNVTCELNMRQGLAAGGLVLNTNIGFTPTSAALNTQRVVNAVASMQATTERIMVRVILATTGAIDITLRIGLPQLELGAFATSVIPTTTTALTRNVDVASMTGTNFSSWFNAVEGTIVSSVLSANGSGARSTTVSDGTINNQFWLRQALAAAAAFEVYTASGFVAQIGAVVAQPMKSAGAYKANDFAVSVNGGAAATDTSGALGSYSQMNIGANYNASTALLNGHIQRISYYPSRLPNTTLQALTA